MNSTDTATTGTVPWHGLGRKVPQGLSADEMLKAANLDWTVEQRSIQAVVKGGKRVTVPNKKALVRSSDNKVLSITGDKWRPIQNSRVFEFLRTFVEAGDLTLEAAGALRGGRNVWALADLGKSFTLATGDEVKGHLLISHPHEWGKSLRIMFTPMRLACLNTLTYELGRVKQDAPYFKFAHSRDFDDDVMRIAAETVGLASKQMEVLEESSKFLADKTYKEKDVVVYLQKLFPSRSKNSRDKQELSRTGAKVYDLLEKQPGAELNPNTWWNAMNAVTHYVDHVAGRSREVALQNAWFGRRAGLKRQALSSAMQFAKAA